MSPKDLFEHRMLGDLNAYFRDSPLPLKLVGPDLRLRRANPAFLQFLGYADNPEDIVGESLTKVIHPDDWEEAEATFVELFEDKRNFFQIDYRHCHREGRVCWASHIALGMSGDDDRNDLALVATVDNSRQKEAEERAQQSLRMQALGELAGGVAHDFNNVLGIVMTISHVLQAKLEARDDHDLLKYLDKIGKAVDRGSSLTHQLLSFSQQQASEDEYLDLNYHIRDISDLLERVLGAQIDLKQDLDPEIPPIKSGISQLDQVVMNLAVNARDAMPDGGTLTLCTSKQSVEAGEAPPHPDLEPGEYVVLVVSDTGVGIDPKTQRHIFEPFFSTKKPGKGTGLGLATVYRIVSRAGGEIFVDSTPGEGTTFTIYFPTVDDASAATKERPSAEVDLEETSLKEVAEEMEPARILLLEDEEDLREPYRMFLESEGHEVLEAASISQARSLADRSDEPIALLLADVVLPDGSGAEFAEELGTKLDGLRVIFLSGYAPELLYQRQEDPELDWEFLPKPVTRGALIGLVRKLLSQ